MLVPGSLATAVVLIPVRVLWLGGLSLLLWETVGRLGDGALRLLPHRERGALAGFGLGLLVGWPILGLSYLGLGMAGLFSPWPLGGAFILMTGVSSFRRSRRVRLLAAARSWAAAGTGGLAVLLLALAPILLSLLSPEREVDSLIYHRGAPWQFLQAHRVLLTWVPASFQIPLPIEMGYALPLLIGDERLIGGITVSMFVGASAVWASRSLAQGRPAAAWLGPLLALALLHLPRLLTVSKNDVAAAALLVAGAIVHQPGSPLLTAALFGLGLSAKLTAAPWVAAWWLAQGPAPRHWIRIAIIVALSSLAWTAKSYFALGNPLFPVGRNLFSTLDWDARNAAAQFKYVLPFWDADTLTPARLPGAFFVHMREESLLVWLAFPGLVWFSRHRRAALACLLGGIGILGLGHASRYLLPVGWLLSLLVAEEGLRITAIPATAIRVGLVVFALVQVSQTAGREWRDDPSRLVASAPGVVARDQTSFDEARRRLRPGPGGRILSVGDLRTWGLPGRVVYGGTLGETPLVWKLVHESPDARRIAVRVRQLGARTLLFNYVNALFVAQYYEPFPWTLPMLERYSAFVRTNLAVAWSGRQEDFLNGGFLAYAVSWHVHARAEATVMFLPGTELTMLPALRLRNAGRLPDAIAELRTWTRRLPGVLFYPTEVATDQALAGDWAAVYRTLRPLWDGGVREVRVASNLGTAALSLGKPDEARAAYRAVLARSDAEADLVRLRLARAWFITAQDQVAAGRTAAAGASLEAGWSCVCAVAPPDGGPALREYHEGRALIQGLQAHLCASRGDRARALLLFHAALQDGPDLPASGYWRERIGQMSRSWPETHP